MKIQLLSALIYVGVFSAVSSQAEATPPRTITVSGQCKRQAVPDTGAVVITSDARELELDRAVSKARKGYDQLRSAVQSLHLANAVLSTTEYTVNPIREWEKNKTVFKGFNARMGLRVETSDFEKLGAVLTKAAELGIQDIGNLEHYLSPAKKLEEQSLCLESAAKNARAKAEKLAGALGAHVGAVQTLSESWDFQSPMPRPMMAMRGSSLKMGAEASDAVGIEPGQENLSVTVNAMFLIE